MEPVTLYGAFKMGESMEDTETKRHLYKQGEGEVVVIKDKLCAVVQLTVQGLLWSLVPRRDLIRSA